MEDFVLKTTVDESRCLYISPIDRDTYAEHVEDDNLGGDDGYFVVLARTDQYPRLEVLAKAPTMQAARALFDLIREIQFVERRAARRSDYSTPLFSD